MRFYGQYRFLLDAFVTTIPTIGFNFEYIKYKNMEIVFW